MWTSDVGESESRPLMQNPRKSASKEFQILSLHRFRKTFFRFFLWLHRCRKTFLVFLSLHRCRKTFFRFFYRFIGPGKLFFVFFYRFIGAGKLFSVFSIASSVQENFLSVFSIASSVKKILPNKIVSLYSIFFSKIVFRYRFNRYIVEYCCPSLLLGHPHSPIPPPRPPHQLEPTPWTKYI